MTGEENVVVFPRTWKSNLLMISSDMSCVLDKVYSQSMLIRPQVLLMYESAILCHFHRLGRGGTDQVKS